MFATCANNCVLQRCGALAAYARYEQRGELLPQYLAPDAGAAAPADFFDAGGGPKGWSPRMVPVAKNRFEKSAIFVKIQHFFLQMLQNLPKKCHISKISAR